MHSAFSVSFWLCNILSTIKNKNVKIFLEVLVLIAFGEGSREFQPS
jgi:hypothetical protein